MNDFLKNYYLLIVKYSEKKFVKEAALSILAILLLLGGRFAFDWYTNQQNIDAFAGLVEISKSYEKSLATAREQSSKSADDQVENPWEDTELLLDSIASTHSSSSLSPFFTMYQAELALEKDGDYDAACALMEKGVRRLSKKSIYYDMFNLKRIKMLLDSPEETASNQALQELQNITVNADNYYQQEALYILATYYEFNKDMEKSIELLTTLAQTKIDKALIVSPFVTQAQEKLKALNISLPNTSKE